MTGTPRHARWWSVLLLPLLWGFSAPVREVRVVYAGSSEGSAWKGVMLGLEEANILGSFTGYRYRVELMSVPELLEAPLVQLPAAVVTTAGPRALRQLSAKFAPAPVAVFNLTADDGALREACLPGLLHVAPSSRMKSDAVAQWRTVHTASDVEARAWHQDFLKFAARDLNKRFRRAQGVPMDDDSWAGWAALKMVSETVARTQTAEPARILAYLQNEMGFDGQKGVPHTFRETGQLRQPLLLVEAGRIVGEAPVRGVADAHDLDSLGLASCSGPGEYD